MSGQIKEASKRKKSSEKAALVNLQKSLQYAYQLTDSTDGDNAGSDTHEVIPKIHNQPRPV